MGSPGFRAPMLATLVDEAPRGPGWIVERKFDGIRIVVVRDGDDVVLFSRNGIDRTDSFPELARALRDVAADRFVADGEVVAFDGDRTSFEALQRRSSPPVLYLFDLVHLDGEDLERRPLTERAALLRARVPAAGPVRLSEHLDGDPAEILEAACAAGWEGLVAKRADSRYRHDRSRDWRKLKCVARQELVVGGWTEPRGARRGLGALLVGHHDAAGDLRYAGKVGTGFDDAWLARLSELLAERARPDSPFVDPPRERGLHWVRPDLVAEIGFTEWTRAGRLRHPRFLGLRDDKDPAEVERERPG